MQVHLVAATVATTVPLVVLALLALRAVRSPRRAAVGFGLPIGDSPADAFVRVYGSRNLAIAAAAGALMIAGEHRALAIVLTCAVPLTVFDMALLRRARMPAPPYARHAIALVLLATATLLWWLA